MSSRWLGVEPVMGVQAQCRPCLLTMAQSYEVFSIQLENICDDRHTIPTEKYLLRQIICDTMFVSGTTVQ
ncbi:hypothetical protein TNCV_4586251 [Trichonephila clavipes]|nr:hypothetical protein TNCV_4586251 [Trichonephila clavipes]